MNTSKFIKDDEFVKRIKDIFDRVIDVNSASKFLYANFLEKCNRNIKYFPNDIVDNFGVFIIKNENYITDSYAIPQIIDYQKDLKEISNVENDLDKTFKDENGEEVSKYLWKDVPDLKEQRKKNIQILVARNMYLFNDSKAHGLWLRAHDENFMKSLVTVFGYTKDKVLLQWVIEKNRFKTESDISNGEDYGKILWHKTCDGKLIFHKEVIDVMVKDFDKEHQSYVDDLFDYVGYLEVEKNSTPLTFKEKAIILANIDRKSVV